MGLFSGISSFLSTPAGGFAGGVADTALGGVIGNYFTQKQNKQLYGYQKALFDYQAEYNSPVNQMARLREAGLNPNLVYENGAASLTSVPSASHGSASVQPAGGMTGLMQYYQRQNLQQDLDNKLAVNARVNAETTSIMEDVNRKKIENDFLRSSGSSKGGLLDYLGGVFRLAGSESVDNESRRDWKRVSDAVKEWKFSVPASGGKDTQRDVQRFMR